MEANIMETQIREKTEKQFFIINLSNFLILLKMSF